MSEPTNRDAFFPHAETHMSDTSPLLVQLLIDQRQRWERGDRIRVEAYLKDYADLAEDPAVLSELVANELVLRREKGEKPEFAEFDCTACHHDLKQNSPRQAYSVAQADRGIIPGQKRVGQLPWGTWYYPLLPTLKSNVGGAPQGLEANLATLDHLMRRKDPPRDEVRRQATLAIAQFDGWISQLIQVLPPV